MYEDDDEEAQKGQGLGVMVLNAGGGTTTGV